MQGLKTCPFTIRMTRKHPFVSDGGIFIKSFSYNRGGDCLMSTIVHFDVPAEDIERAKKFYFTLLGWKFESFPEMQYQPDHHNKPGWNTGSWRGYG